MLELAHPLDELFDRGAAFICRNVELAGEPLGQGRERGLGRLGAVADLLTPRFIDKDDNDIAKAEIPSARLWSSVHRCWLGAPLARSETIDARITSLARELPPTIAATDWPKRCAHEAARPRNAAGRRRGETLALPDSAVTIGAARSIVEPQ